MGENILIRFLRDQNEDFWKHISVDGALDKPRLILDEMYHLYGEVRALAKTRIK